MGQVTISKVGEPLGDKLATTCNPTLFKRRLAALVSKYVTRQSPVRIARGSDNLSTIRHRTSKFPNISLTEFPVRRPGTHVESLKFGNATRIISIFSMIADTVSVLVQGSSTSTPQSDRSICYATRANRNLEVCWHRVSRQSQETWIKYMGSFRWLQQSAYPCERRAVWCKLEKYKFKKQLKKKHGILKSEDATKKRKKGSGRPRRSLRLETAQGTRFRVPNVIF